MNSWQASRPDTSLHATMTCSCTCGSSGSRPAEETTFRSWKYLYFEFLGESMRELDSKMQTRCQERWRQRGLRRRRMNPAAAVLKA